MKKVILSFTILITIIVFGQKLPVLKLSNLSDSKIEIKSPTELKKGEICITLITGAGMSAYDYYTHYIFTNDGDIKSFKEEVPKTYLKNPKLKRTTTKIEIDEQTKLKLWNNLNSKSTTEFTGFSQKDFFKPIKIKTIQPPCINDASGYSISFIQDNKQKIYSFYAPEYYYDGKCKNENINRKMLEKFVKLLKLWEVI
ncbi:hypothetical protein [Flavobacterium phycosphaerae]|uniref:hypothetical protein n=1 Tax=Flavobacterium phycosphaerae TaxID=2697515 RepID=UPI0013899BD2|nr:hypothetical protein [Flavobacterium phycosphaerae]